jgi:phage head maturation protease
LSKTAVVIGLKFTQANYQNMNRTLSAQFERAASDKTARTVQAVLSTETPVNRGGVFEILTHTSASIDLSRFPLPVIINHDSYNLPIAVAENPKITGGKLRATIRFSESEQATSVFNDVTAGITTNLSIGYRITESHKETRGGQEFLIVDSWNPHECSIVAIPADQNAGFNRNFQPLEQNMNLKIQNQFNERNLEIEKISQNLDLDERQVKYLIDSNMSIEDVHKFALDTLVERSQRHTIIPYHFSSNNEYIGNQNLELRTAVGDALLMRANIPVSNPSPAARDFNNVGISEIAKIFLNQNGKNNAFGLNETSVIKRAFETSSDFVGLLDSIQNKAMQNAYQMQDVTFEHWTSFRSSNFFRDATIVNLGEMPALAKVMEGGEYTYGSVDSVSEKLSIAKYGRIFSLTWEALRRDDLGAFLTLPARFGAEAKRTEATLCYSALTSNPILSDGKTFFHASRGNLTASPMNLSLESLSLARASMRKFKGLGNIQYVDAVPVTLLVPVALETTAQQLVATITATKSSDVMPEWIKKLTVVADPRLDEVSEKDWYLFADPKSIEGFTRVYLDGEAVSIEQDLGFDIDGMKFKCRLAMGVGAVDWRAAYKTIGA